MVGSLGPSLQRRNSAAAHKRAAAAAAASKGGSIAFNGSTQYLTLATDADLVFGLGDFTIQGWIYATSLGQTRTILDWRTSSSSVTPSILLSSGGQLSFNASGVARITGTATISLNTWYFVAWSKSAGTIRQYVSGNIDGTPYADSANYISSALTIGTTAYSAGTNSFSGLITDLEIIKGNGLYTGSSFGIPNTRISPHANTKLLLHAQDSGTQLTDSSGLNKTVTNHGTTWSSSNPF